MEQRPSPFVVVSPHTKTERKTETNQRNVKRVLVPTKLNGCIPTQRQTQKQRQSPENEDPGVDSIEAMSTSVQRQRQFPTPAAASSLPRGTSESTEEEGSFKSRTTVEKGVVEELLLVCGVIGTTTTDGEELVPVTDCLNWLQDLQRALRRDDDAFRPISLLISKWRVVEQKLLPLILSCRYDNAMVLTIVKILVILTKPLNEVTKAHGRAAIKTKSNASEKK